ncbi:MAG: PAS domain S-box protein [Methylococcaceae bacterium]|nr:MAG: PAS domain S-box protein [Methylococcaceae bacterium]
MNDKPGTKTSYLSQLRTEADATLAKLFVSNPQDVRDDVTANLLHELLVHQTELAMQNEELRRVQIELEQSRDRYAELYEFAPIGYLTLNRDALIVECNLTTTTLLKAQRGQLLSRRLAQFIAPPDQDRWHRFFVSVVRHGGKHSGEFAFQRSDGVELHARLECHAESGGEKPPLVRMALIDVGAQKRAEEPRIADTA